ncbi:hypothetical protein K227x_11980 [Rubripirellula lacrimiformis]|uniref:Uncharacterized protein n=1 Tax=Rubripirellula lacrimiformis TaxID=1930273 RepID=A0A517N6T0_9BACT|nr:hypothetical protein [Rubripirellula lacrimiformis]QDT02820.1 hypothetical protein K227x_11980 [Rubripirellula lacrimiformis]
MRFELIVAAVTRNVVKAMVREITVVRSFVNATILHRWLHQMPEGIASYLIDSTTPDDFAALISARGTDSKLLSALAGSKRGRVQHQPCLVLASCPARSSRG